MKKSTPAGITDPFIKTLVVLLILLAFSLVPFGEGICQQEPVCSVQISRADDAENIDSHTVILQLILNFGEFAWLRIEPKGDEKRLYPTAAWIAEEQVSLLKSDADRVSRLTVRWNLKEDGLYLELPQEVRNGDTLRIELESPSAMESPEKGLSLYLSRDGIQWQEQSAATRQ